jgi:hypothetical protein
MKTKRIAAQKSGPIHLLMAHSWKKTIELSTAACESTAVAIPVTLSIPPRCSVEGKMLNGNATPAVKCHGAGHAQ